MPAKGITKLKHSDILSFTEIIETIKYGVTLGINKVRITGGEPLVRKGIVQLVESIAKIDGIKDFAMTTNGALLAPLAKDLKNAGLHRVNISLDTTNPIQFNTITRIGNLTDVMEGIFEAQRVELTPIKLNCVIKKDSNEADAQSVALFAQKYGLAVRFIPKMNLGNGTFGIVEGGDGGNCTSCNRLRLTSTGDLKPCLFNELGYNIRTLGIPQAYDLALKNKPLTGEKNTSGSFYSIGG